MVKNIYLDIKINLLPGVEKIIFLLLTWYFLKELTPKKSTTKCTILGPFKSVSHQKKDLSKLKMPFFIFLHKYVFS